MATYIQEGNRIDYTNSGTKTIACGDVVEFPARVGVAITEIAATETGTVSLTEAFEFQTAAEAIPQGTLVYWDSTNKVVTKTDTNNKRVGVAITAKTGSAAGSVVVRLE